MQQGFLNFLASGKGLVSLHAAAINFDTWPEYAQMMGGIWEWGKAGHGPYRPGWWMSIVDPHHPITEGIDDFEIHDELYHTLTITRLVHPLLMTLWDGKLQPMAWVTDYGTARIHYNALGHGPETFRCEPFREMLRRGVLWAAKRI
jgi:type 1 glutamine amidotransferase